MAKREVLQDLQKRIARLLQESHTQTADAASWLGVRLGGYRVLLPLQQAGEIYPWSNQIQRLAYTKPWFLGVAALRGKLYGAVEFSEFLVHDHLGQNRVRNEEHKIDAQGKQRLIAVNEAFGVNVVLRVDALEGLRSQNNFSHSELVKKDKPAHYGGIFYEKSGVVWQEINLQALCQTPDFLDIASSRQASSDLLAVS